MATQQPLTLIGYPVVSTWNRQAIGRYLSMFATHTTGVGVRGGVILAGGDPFKVVHTTGRDITVNPGALLLPTTDSVGPLAIVEPAPKALTADPADGTNPRYDLVIIEVEGTGTSTTTGNVRIVKGVPASSPQIPSTNWATPSNPVAKPLGDGGWLPLGALYIPSSGSSGSITGVTDLRAWSVAAGGVVPIPGAWATPSLAAALPPYTVVWDATSGRLAVRDTGTGLVRSDVPPVGLRYWAGSIDVPTAAAYDMGVLGAPTGSYGASYVAVHANAHDLAVNAAGLYRIDTEVLMVSSNATGYTTIKINDVAVRYSGFDAQGRCNMGITRPLNSGDRINLAFNHTSGSTRTFNFTTDVTRLA